MNNIEFYKSIYEREFKRRFDLDNALNIPIGLVVVLLALVSFIISSLNFSKHITANWIILGLIFISVLLIISAIIFLARSYNNVFKNHKYLNLPFTYYLREYQLNLELYNSKVNKETDKIDFDSQLIERLNHYTDNHILVNEFRARNLAYAKTVLILSVFILLVASILVITIKYLL